MLSIALPKGRLGNKVYKIFAQIGLSCEEMNDNTRALIFENEEKSVRYLMVKPSDVAVYVERGAADIGIVGSDVLYEDESDVYELLDLKFGKCKMAVAAKNGFYEDKSLPLRVATKYPMTALKYYEKKSRRIDIIKLHGSIELAPILDMSDVIVDIVETGRTLKENNLSVTDEIMDVSARFIANKSSYKFNKEQIDKLCRALEEKI